MTERAISLTGLEVEVANFPTEHVPRVHRQTRVLFEDIDVSKIARSAEYDGTGYGSVTLFWTPEIEHAVSRLAGLATSSPVSYLVHVSAHEAATISCTGRVRIEYEP